MLIRSLTLAVIVLGLVASVALTTLRSTPSRAVQSQHTSACTTSWSKPYAPMVSNGYLHVSAPQIVAVHGGVALLGDNAVALAPTDAGFIPIAGWPRGDDMLAGFLFTAHGDVTPIPGPPGVRAFIEVKAAAANGLAHVFWGGSADTSASQSQHVNSLWYARYDGRHWTRPELILDDTTLLWAQQLTSIAVTGRRAHVTALIDGDSLSPDVLHVVRDATGKGRLARLGFQAMYTDLQIDRAGSLWLTTIAGDRTNRAKVLVRRSTDDGHTWTEPIVVYRSGRGTAYDPRLAITRNGSMHVAWIIAQPTNDAGFSTRSGDADRIGLAASRDGGLRWDRLPDIAEVPDLRDLWVVPDGAASLQLTFHTDDAGGQVVALGLHGDEPGIRSRFGPTWFAASLAAASPDSLHLAWHEWRSSGTERIPTLTLSRRRACLE